MRQSSRWCLAVLVLIGGSCGLASCGGSEDAIVRVGQTPITRATVGHWMEVMVAGDYRYAKNAPAPAGLVTDPPNYGKCGTTAQKLSKNTKRQNAERLCRQLYQAVKLQAVNFLTNAAWYAEDAREHGETVTSKEIERNYLRLQRQEFPKSGQIERYLAELHRTKADEYFLIKRNLLSQRFVERLKRQHVDLASSTAALKLASEWQKKWTARTSCQPGFVASQCKQYKGPETVPAPDNVLQELAG